MGLEARHGRRNDGVRYSDIRPWIPAGRGPRTCLVSPGPSRATRCRGSATCRRFRRRRSTRDRPPQPARALPVAGVVSSGHRTRRALGLLRHDRSGGEKGTAMGRSGFCSYCRSAHPLREGRDGDRSQSVCPVCGSLLDVGPGGEGTGEPATIPCIDDDRLLRSFFSDALERRGFRTLVATDGGWEAWMLGGSTTRCGRRGTPILRQSEDRPPGRHVRSDRMGVGAARQSGLAREGGRRGVGAYGQSALCFESAV